MIENPLMCPNCKQIIMDIKHGDFIIRSSTEVDEEARAEGVRLCPRCKKKFIISVK
jgi:ribosomal protein L34E